MALEVRYVGNRNNNTWAEEDWNERSIFNSGFYNEFFAAQRNIAANIAAGLANRGFAYTGAPGTSPLPIHLAYLNGSRDVNNPAAYAHANFTNSGFVNRFSARRPQVSGAINAIDTAAFRANALAAGMARNLIVMNPMVSGTFVIAGPELDEVRQPAGRAAPPLHAGSARRCELHLRHQEAVPADDAGGRARRSGHLG